MKTTVILSMATAIVVTAGAASAATGETTTGSHIKRLETVVAETDARKPAVQRPTTGSRVKRLEDLSVLSDADKTDRQGASPASEDVAALLEEADAAEASD